MKKFILLILSCTLLYTMEKAEDIDIEKYEMKNRYRRQYDIPSEPVLQEGATQQRPCLQRCGYGCAHCCCSCLHICFGLCFLWGCKKATTMHDK